MIASKWEGIAKKRFTSFITGCLAKQAPPPPPITARAVSDDLRRGSLATLAYWVKSPGVIADEQVAEQLVRLLTGSADQTPYRITISRHPDLPKLVGGAPAGKRRSNAERDARILDQYYRLTAAGWKHYLAIEEVARAHELSSKTVRRVLKDTSSIAAAVLQLCWSLAGAPPLDAAQTSELLTNRTTALRRLRERQ